MHAHVLSYQLALYEALIKLEAVMEFFCLRTKIFKTFCAITQTLSWYKNFLKH